jgi:DNA-binding response OmpR family regulator
MKILVCDDDQGILEVMRIILEEQKYEVRTLNTGKHILKIVKEFNPNVFFLDLWMPGIDGREITKILKRDPETKDIPIIVVSALNDTQKVASEAGADDYLAKPFDMNDLIAKVQKYA